MSYKCLGCEKSEIIQHQVKEMLKKGIHREVKNDTGIRAECQVSITAVGTLASQY